MLRCEHACKVRQASTLRIITVTWAAFKSSQAEIRQTIAEFQKSSSIRMQRGHAHMHASVARLFTIVCCIIVSLPWLGIC